MKLFIPEIVYVDPRVLKIESAKKTLEYLKKMNIPIVSTRTVLIDGLSPIENYVKAKKTILLTINAQKKLKTCQPSADYQFNLSLSCPGHCEYCYLQTTQGEKPIIKVFVNIDEILEGICDHIVAHLPDITTFESGSLTDPVALDHLTGNLVKCIEFFANQKNGQLRIITKYPHVDPYLNLQHNQHTKFRFSINTKTVINQFEHHTALYEERIEAARKVAQAGYPIGFIIAPIMIYEGWKEDYQQLIVLLQEQLKGYEEKITFELIQHRFTATAKELILKRFPNSKLDLKEENRILKWGPYGKFKYVYPKATSTEMKNHISQLIHDNFKNAEIEYFT